MTSWRHQKGFTLIEVIISLAIMSTMGLLAAQSIRQSVNQKKKIQTQIDEVSAARDALHLMERDINLAYHHLDWEKELRDLVNSKAKPTQGQQPNQGQPAYPNSPIQPGQPVDLFKQTVERIDPTTNFVGTADEINFVTFHNARLIRNQKQADFAEVGYSVRSCKAKSTGNQVKCLWRRFSPIADKDVTKGGDEVVLLENVTEFKLEYLGQPKEDWVEQWNTQGSDDSIKNRFPMAVKISLTTQNTQTDPPGKKYELQTVAAIHFPNNPPISDTGTTAPPLPGAPPNPPGPQGAGQ